MGNYFSNKKDILDNPTLVVCDAKRLQRLLHKHRFNAKIITVLNKIPYACNYMYNPTTYIAEISDFFENYNRCKRPLWFQVGYLKFCTGCNIVLTEIHHDEICQLEKSNEIIPLSKSDKRLLYDYNFLCIDDVLE